MSDAREEAWEKWKRGQIILDHDAVERNADIFFAGYDAATERLEAQLETVQGALRNAEKSIEFLLPFEERAVQAEAEARWWEAFYWHSDTRVVNLVDVYSPDDPQGSADRFRRDLERLAGVPEGHAVVHAIEERLEQALRERDEARQAHTDADAALQSLMEKYDPQAESNAQALAESLVAWREQAEVAWQAFHGEHPQGTGVPADYRDCPSCRALTGVPPNTQDGLLTELSNALNSWVGLEVDGREVARVREQHQTLLERTLRGDGPYGTQEGNDG